MAYKIEEIEGIGAAYGERLNAFGIATTDDLLAKGGARSGRAAIASATGISESLILTWVNHADLFRIKGIAGQFSELLEAAGVDTVKELATRNADNLHAKLDEVNAAKGLSGRIPPIDALKEMIETAKGLEPMVSH
jgi:predicted flap endonuclease-1-like 5' DNA nuclease